LCPHARHLVFRDLVELLGRALQPVHHLRIMLGGEFPDLPLAHILPTVGIVDVDRKGSELSHEGLAVPRTALPTKCNFSPTIRKWLLEVRGRDMAPRGFRVPRFPVDLAPPAAACRIAAGDCRRDRLLRLLA